MEESMSVVLTGTKIGRSNKRPTFAANERKLTDLILSLGGAVGVVWLNQRNRWDESCTFIYSTPRLLELEILNNKTLIFQHPPVSSNIFYNLKIAKEYNILKNKLKALQIKILKCRSWEMNFHKFSRFFLWLHL